VKRTHLSDDPHEGVYTFSEKEGRYIPARCLPFSYDPITNFFIRLKLAYGVFTGRYDALDWE
jgi:hypothetical protein